MKQPKLFAPKDYGEQPNPYHQASKSQLDEAVGGCGPGGAGDTLVPDRLLFLLIKEACKIHDWMYAWGKTLEDKELADRVFLNNMLRIIRANSSKIFGVNYLRKRLAFGYYLAVKGFGAPAFWDGKNDAREFV